MEHPLLTHPLLKSEFSKLVNLINAKLMHGHVARAYINRVPGAVLDIFEKNRPEELLECDVCIVRDGSDLGKAAALRNTSNKVLFLFGYNEPPERYFTSCCDLVQAREPLDKIEELVEIIAINLEDLKEDIRLSISFDEFKIFFTSQPDYLELNKFVKDECDHILEKLNHSIVYLDYEQSYELAVDFLHCVDWYTENVPNDITPSFSKFLDIFEKIVELKDNDSED